jgi:hypothetical protein
MVYASQKSKWRAARVASCCFRHEKKRQSVWLMSRIPAPGRGRQEDLEFKTNLDCKGSLKPA